MDIYTFKNLSYIDKMKHTPKDKYHKCKCEYSNRLNAYCYELELCMCFYHKDAEIKQYALKIYDEYVRLMELK